MYLPSGTRLHQRYVIEAVLGVGGFGVTYLATDTLLNVKVAVKEYLPRQLATRGEGQTQVTVFTGEVGEQYHYGLKKFLEEAQALAQFAAQPNIVTCNDFFAENGTAYLVMHYIEGLTLKEYLVQQGGRIPFETAVGIMMPVMDALREVHQANLLHRDISPDNIFLTTGNQVKLIDFGAARYQAGEQSKSLSVILKPGYAPEEQYRSSGRQGPWTDVYAVAATIYKAITGQNPPEALDRLTEDTLVPPSRLGVTIPPGAEVALLHALAVRASQRCQAMPEFQRALTGQAPAPEITMARAQGKEPQFPGPAPLTRKIRQTSWVAILPWMLLGLLAAGAGVYQFLPGQKTPIPTRNSAPARIDQAPPAPMTAESATEPVHKQINTWKDPITGMEFVWVPGGTFLMGGGHWAGGAVEGREKPVHEVKMDGFWLGKYEVTQGQWEQIRGRNPAHFKKGDTYPVEKVSWLEAQEFIKSLNNQSSETDTFSLPTEAQWEYAARSGGKEELYAGGNSIDEFAWHGGNSGASTHPVGQKRPNGLGIYDMSGNVWEWCEDTFSDGAYSRHQQHNPVLRDSQAGNWRVIRGGSWPLPPNSARTTYRGRTDPQFRGDHIGFRLVRIESWPTRDTPLPNRTEPLQVAPLPKQLPTREPVEAFPGLPPPPPPVPAVPQVRREFPRMWRVEWRGGRTNALYAGSLAIHNQLNDQAYTGVMSIQTPQGQVVTQQAVVSVAGAKVIIRCSKPSLASYPADHFFLDLKGNTMTGFDKDVQGNVGYGVTFTAVTQ
jgi:formylglycine-generating enzyme required for sulfatase activity/serine/threonine protein kinase